MYAELFGEGVDVAAVDPDLLNDIAASVYQMRDKPNRQPSGGSQPPPRQPSAGLAGRASAAAAAAADAAPASPTSRNPGGGGGGGSSSSSSHGGADADVTPLPAAAAAAPSPYKRLLLASQQQPAAGGAQQCGKGQLQAIPQGTQEDFPALPKPAAPPPKVALASGGGVGTSSTSVRRSARAGGHSHHHLHHHNRQHHGHHWSGVAVGRHDGVKVLHAAQPGHAHGHSHAQPGGVGSNGGGASNGSAAASSNGLHGGADDAEHSLWWDLLDSGLCLLADPLAPQPQHHAAAGAGGDVSLDAPLDAATKAVTQRLARAQCAQEEGKEGPARGVSPEEMIAMMARAHRRQVGARAGGAGDGDESRQCYYYRSHDDSRSWRRTVEWMERNDWVQVTDTDGKHAKYRRMLPNGRIQTQTVCCSPSDALRGVRNLQADLARKDAEANATIRTWRRQQLKAAAESAAAAAAAAARDADDD